MHVPPQSRAPLNRAALAFLVLVAMVGGVLVVPAGAGGNGKGKKSGDGTTETAVSDETPSSTSDSHRNNRKSTGDTTTTDALVDAPDHGLVLEPLDSAASSDEIAPVVDLDVYQPAEELGSLYNVVDQIGARELWTQGYTGTGIDVAVIDTGVAPVSALTGADKVKAMVDLSFEAGVAEAIYLDTNGHGSHITGIIAGRDPGADPATAADRPGEFLGVAPDAGIVSVKVGDNTGAVDVSQVIAAIDWVVQHRNEGDLNIRVINLSYGTDSSQDYRIDPLARAVENAWEHGIVVVAASGNDGWNNNTGGMTNPAFDPYVIAVGAAEVTEYDVGIPKWASAGDYYSLDGDGRRVNYWEAAFTGRLPDVVAPGSHIDSLRVPGSRIDAEHPEGYVSETVFRGSGTSQAAAVVSGAVALMLDHRPDLTPDQVKALLRDTAAPVPGWAEPYAGQGLINVLRAAKTAAPDVKQSWERSTGLGSLEAARGTQHVVLDGVVLEGEVTAFGSEWDPATWVKLSTLGASWSGASWTGASWTGASWSGASWSGASWSGASWSGASWSGASWSGASWSGASWSGASWSGASWSGASWSGASWS